MGAKDDEVSVEVDDVELSSLTEVVAAVLVVDVELPSLKGADVSVVVDDVELSCLIDSDVSAEVEDVVLSSLMDVEVSVEIDDVEIILSSMVFESVLQAASEMLGGNIFPQVFPKYPSLQSQATSPVSWAK